MKSFVFRSILPTFLTVALFIMAIMHFVLPTLEKSIMDQKREMIRELTNAAWNILARFEYDERTGSMTRQEAQQLAIEAVQNLHYGQGMKDYFWINDMHPRMIIHPYRPDLNGKDLSEIQDPSGKKIFVRFVETVKAGGAGYVNYQWQWKDDSSNIAPKISYVKGFEPWGWVIGTGVYVNDVQTEISSIRNKLIFSSTIILIIASGLLFFLLSDSYLNEKKRIRAENNLRASEEKYRILVESAGEYMIMSLCGQKLFANNSMLKLLDYTANEFSEKDISQIVELSEAEKKLGMPYSAALLRGETIPAQYETNLITKDGTKKRVLISLSTIPQQESAGFLMMASKVSAQHEKVVKQDRLLEELQRTLLFFHQRIGEIDNTPVSVLLKDSDALASAGKFFADPACCAILVTASDNSVKGMLTPARFAMFTADNTENLHKNLAGLTLEPAVFIESDALLFDAYLEFENNGYRPIFFKDNQENTFKTVNDLSFIALHNYSPTCVLREIQTATCEETMIKATGLLPELARVFIQNKTAVGQINRLITDVADLTLEKAIEMARQQFGPPPVEFCFLVMGSQGRREQTLCTDQDNAILFEDVAPERIPEVQQYFLKFGEFVCNLLNQCHYAFCQGNIMAKNPDWCQPLSKWKEKFSTWIKTMEAEDLLQSRIFFDFRPTVSAHGKNDKTVQMIENLHAHLESELAESPRFFFLMARNILQYDPPLGVFGNFIVQSIDGEMDVLDIKSVMSMIVDFARIYALKHGIRERNTHERLRILRDMEILTDQAYYELKIAYSYLMRIRLDKQAVAIDHGQKPENFVRPDMLTSIDQKILKEIFAQIKNFQVKLSYDFTGMLNTG